MGDRDRGGDSIAWEHLITHTALLVAGVGGTSEPPIDWEHLYEMELTEPQGAMAKAGTPK